MSRRRKKGGRFDDPDPEMDLTPMIDIVFQLLIFFLCATKFKTPEGMLEAFLPKDKGQNSGSAPADPNECRIKLLYFCDKNHLVGMKSDGTTVCDEGCGKIDPDDNGWVLLKVGKIPMNNRKYWEKEKYPSLSDKWVLLFNKLIDLKKNYTGKKPSMPVKIDAYPQVPVKLVVATLNEVVRAGLSDVTFAASARHSSEW